MYVNEKKAHARRKAAPWIHGDNPKTQRPDDKMLLLAGITTSCTVWIIQCNEPWLHLFV